MEVMEVMILLFAIIIDFCTFLWTNKLCNPGQWFTGENTVHCFSIVQNSTKWVYPCLCARARCVVRYSPSELQVGCTTLCSWGRSLWWYIWCSEYMSITQDLLHISAKMKWEIWSKFLHNAGLSMFFHSIITQMGGHCCNHTRGCSDSLIMAM